MSKLDYCFSNDYMVLRPDRAGPVELLHLLFSPKVGRNRAVDCFTSTEIRSFRRRLAIFLNLLLQVILLSLAGPLAALGAGVELVLNLVDNVLHGKMEYPDRSSPAYRSMTALIDRRVDLDRSIKPTDYTIRDAVKELLEANKTARLLVTGHGSGGALAVLFSAVLAYHKEKPVLDRLAGVYTFAQPRVGDALFAMLAERNLDRPKKRHFRVTYGDDSLLGLPNERSAVHFLHFGLRIHFDRSYELKVLRETPGESQTSPSVLALVTSRINSAWELGRGVYLGYRRGAYFREGWLLLLMRVLALALPGLPVHRVQDYVNGVLLGGYFPKDN